jgi:hypothetical protein
VAAIAVRASSTGHQVGWIDDVASRKHAHLEPPTAMSADLNSTRENDERAEWSARSGVGSDVFDLELPDW